MLILQLISPLSSFLWPIIVLIIGGIAVTFLFVAGKKNGAKGHLIFKDWRN